MGLPCPGVLTALTSIRNELAPNDHSAALALLEEYDDLFSTVPHDLSLLKITHYQLDIEYFCSFRAQPYNKPKSE